MLSITGLFILYRYIKSIEKDSKIVQNYLLELELRVKNIEKQQNTITNTKITTSSEPQPQQKPQIIENVTIDEDELKTLPDDDNESIGSEDITNLLKKVILENCDVHNDNNSEIFDEISEINEVLDVTNDVDVNTETEQNVEVEVNDTDKDSNTDHLDDITISYKTESQYKKMTLPELREILKEKNMNTKGSKSELVKRILNC
jgi:tRNA splicing endonuclease|tara:strand:- start:33410 stop:34018 length:609 start_codon:yes stop_codon:yes gene_type:complete